jgi:hypothetical protein
MIPARGWIVVAGVALLIIAMGRARADDRQVVVVVGLTCLDIQALAGWKGWDEIERRATAAGQTKEQIKRAKACLK